MRNWTLLAHLAVGARVNGKEHQEIVLGNYLEQAYRLGIQDANAEKLESLKMLCVPMSIEQLEEIYPPKAMGAKRRAK